MKRSSSGLLLASAALALGTFPGLRESVAFSAFLITLMGAVGLLLREDECSRARVISTCVAVALISLIAHNLRVPHAWLMSFAIALSAVAWQSSGEQRAKWKLDAWLFASSRA